MDNPQQQNDTSAISRLFSRRRSSGRDTSGEGGARKQQVISLQRRRSTTSDIHSGTQTQPTESTGFIRRFSRVRKMSQEEASTGLSAKDSPLKISSAMNLIPSELRCFSFDSDNTSTPLLRNSQLIELQKEAHKEHMQSASVTNAGEGEVAQVAQRFSGAVGAPKIDDAHLKKNSERCGTECLRKFARRITRSMSTFQPVLAVLSPEVTLTIFVESTHTVEQLAWLIEATYAHTENKHLLGLSSKTKISANGATFSSSIESQICESPRSPGGENSGSAAEVKSLNAEVASPLPDSSSEKNSRDYGYWRTIKVCVLCDNNGQPLSFRSRVRDVITPGDSVQVHHTTCEMKATSSGRVERDNLLPVVKSDCEILKEMYQETSWSIFTLRGILSNHTAMALFREFCIMASALEYLLFWLEVEIFRDLQPSNHPVMAKYIYLMYISDTAPLKLEITTEARKEIAFNLTRELNESLFDELQLHSLVVLQRLYCPKFQKTTVFKDLAQFYEEEYEAYLQHTIVGPIVSNFGVDLGVMQDFCNMSELYSGKIPTFLAEVFLNRVIHTYFPTAEPVVAYRAAAEKFVASRTLRIKKKQKLKKFFGAAMPGKHDNFEDHMNQQILSMEGVPETEETYTPLASTHNLSHSDPAVDPMLGSDEVSSTACDEDAENAAEVLAKKRRADKLSYFFGTQPETSLVITTQTKQLCCSTGNVKKEIPQDARQQMARRSKKLKQLLGADLYETGNFETILRRNYYMQMSKSAENTKSTESFDAVQIVSDSNSEDQERSDDAEDTVEDGQGAASPEGPATGSKQQKLKRREKLGHIFGDNEPLKNNDILNIKQQQAQSQPEGRRFASRRSILLHSNKLRRVFGAPPPQMYLTRAQRKTMAIRHSITTIALMLEDKKGAQQMLLYAASREKRNMANGGSAGGFAGASSSSLSNGSSAGTIGGGLLQPSAATLTPPAQNNVSYMTLLTRLAQQEMEGEDSDSQSKPVTAAVMKSRKAEQMRRLTKLHNFFGDAVDPAYLIERHIISELEQQIERDSSSDDAVKTSLKEDLTNLRGQVRNMKCF